MILDSAFQRKGGKLSLSRQRDRAQQCVCGGHNHRGRVVALDKGARACKADSTSTQDRKKKAPNSKIGIKKDQRTFTNDPARCEMNE
jgi:hypothetical protein